MISITDQAMALTILCLFGLLAFSQAGVLKTYFDPRIVNGEDAEVGEIPYQVSLQDPTGFHFCGGSVLSKDYVITAAHCVDGRDPKSTKVVAGSIDLNDPKLKTDVEKIIVHKDYNAGDSWKNDIALLKVKTEFKTTETLKFVTLPRKNQLVKPNDPAIVSGWGRLWQGGPTTNKLQRVNIIIADQIDCRQKYNRLGYNVFDSQVCAYDPKIEKGSCHGDSGGPLVVRDEITGLVSWANGCASTNYATVYTRVSSYIDWIKANAV